MSKEKKDENVVAIPTDEKVLAEMLKPAPGTEQIDSSEDIQLARWRLLQDTSAEVKSQETKAGKIKHTLSGIELESIEFIPISLSKTRIMFNADSRGGAPLCRSNDFMTGSDGTKCKECGNAKWVQNKPPICNLIYNYLTIQPNEVNSVILPTILSFMKTSAQAALKLNMSVENTLPRKPFWSFLWKVTPKLKRSVKGDFYSLDVMQVRETTKEEKAWAEFIYKNMQGKKVDLTADDLAVEDITTDA